ncbi:AAA family ATPase [Chryseobacterium sp. X308]|uniref:McrB family protein n=1 Tax=Chryseobacterium sp. X308 TaxID=2884873 RepID=UPI001D14DD37|nr:AAA family ATPase [Chryseobacterium sp. X308]MCC3214844.1 AAA family ATPase [Chryseobacterium sp. X308]
MTFTELIDEIEIWEPWKVEYNRFVPQFVAEASTGKNWEDWNNELFYEFFMRSADQCVSSLRQGYFTHAEKDLIKRNWPELSALLQKIALSQEQPLFETYHQIKELIRMYTGNNKKAATNRLIAGLQPQLLCTIVNQDKLGQLVYLLNTHVEDFKMELTYDWFEDSHHLLQIFKEKLKKDGFEIVTLPWQVYDYFQEQNTPSSEEQNNMNKNKLEQQIQILEYKKQIILQGPPGTGKTRQAKELAVELLGLNNTKELKNHPQFKLIQFHPSYSYEDFVRGIVARPDEEGNGIIYEAENKVLGDFIKRACEHSQLINEFPHAEWLDEMFEHFKTSIEEELIANDHKIQLTNKLFLTHIGENSFHISSEGWKGDRLKFSEIKKLYKYNITRKGETIGFDDLAKTVYHRTSYYFPMVDKFRNFLEGKSAPVDNKSQSHSENYVLVVDEINRANLSSVLGELIYALEYRGQAVESVYEVDGKRDLILPHNLYIIGTMNTADRSVGHIDYAIRRRFAFIDVLPESLEHDTSIHFNTEGFEKVSELFKNGNVSGEFEAKDVQLGHSYFIAKNEDIQDGYTKEEIFRMKMNYEVVPILLEYVKDGVLIGSHDGKDIKEYINDLKTNN